MQIRLPALVFAYWLSQAMLFPITAPYAVDLGASASLVAVIISFQALPALFLAIPLGNLVDIWGVNRTLICGGVLASGSIAVVPLVDRPELLLLTQAGIGCGALAMWIPLQSLMITPPAPGSALTLETQIANTSTAAAGGQLSGPIVAGLLGDVIGPRLTYPIVACIAAFGLLFSIGMTAKRPHAYLEHQVKQILRSSKSSYLRALKLLSSEPGIAVAVIYSFANMYLTSIATFVYPLYFTSIDVRLSEVGLILTTGSAASLLSRLFVIRMISRVGRAKAILLLLIPGAVATSSIGLVHGLPVYLLLSALSGLTLGAGHILTLSLTAGATQEADRGVSVSLRMVANRTAQSLTPLMFAGMVVVVDFSTAFILNGLIVVGLACTVSYMLRRQ